MDRLGQFVSATLPFTMQYGEYLQANFVTNRSFSLFGEFTLASFLTKVISNPAVPDISA